MLRSKRKMDIWNKYWKRIIWYSVMTFAITFFLLQGLNSRGETVLGALQPFEEDSFMDFFNSLQYGRTPYERGVIYPPLANLFYAVVGHFIPEGVLWQGTIAIRESQCGRFVMAMYGSVTTALLVLIMNRLKKGSNIEKGCFVILLLLSGPFMFEIERANIILISLLCSIVFVLCYDSDVWYLRHIGFLSLAIAVSIKIYPVFFGLLIIRNKKWKDAVICVIYGTIVFFLPFIFFGGFPAIITMVKNIMTASNMFSGLGEGDMVSIASVMRLIGVLVFGDDMKCHAIEMALKLVCLLGGSILIVFADLKDKWRIYAIPTLMMVLIPDFSFQYTLIYMTIPLACFLDEEGSPHTILECIYLCGFILIFVPIVNPHVPWLDIFSNDYYAVNISTIIRGVTVLIFMVLLWTEAVYKTVGIRVHLQKL